MAGKRYEELSTDYVDRTSAPSPSVFSAKHDASKEAISSDFQETLQLQLLDAKAGDVITCLLYTSPSPRDQRGSRMPSSA